MTVSELIKALKERPGEMQVVLDVGGRMVEMTEDRLGITAVVSRGTESDDYLLTIKASFGVVNSGQGS